MKKNTKILIGLLILALIVGVIFYGVSEMGAGKARKIEKRQKVANETYIDRKTIDKRSRLPKEVKQKVEKEVTDEALRPPLSVNFDKLLKKEVKQKVEKETYIDPKTIDKKSRLLKETTKEIGTSKEETQEEYNKWLEKKESCQQKQLNCFQKAYLEKIDIELWPMGMVLSPNAINACVQEEDSSCSEFAVCKNKGLQPFSFDIENQKGVTIVHPNLQEFEIGAYCKDTIQNLWKDENQGEDGIFVKCNTPDLINYSLYNKADYKGEIIISLDGEGWVIPVCIDGIFKFIDILYFEPVTATDGTKLVHYHYIDPEKDLYNIDIDNDGIYNSADEDIDGDGFLNAVDSDMDGDDILDSQDKKIAGDVDGDKTIDADDAFPIDPAEWMDNDGDGVGDNKDAFPLDPTESIDTDGDKIGNNSDDDDDNNGIPDEEDTTIIPSSYPTNPTKGYNHDMDGDGKLNWEDNDIDGDGTVNVNDKDMDNDGKLNKDEYGEYDDVDGDGIKNWKDNDLIRFKKVFSLNWCFDISEISDGRKLCWDYLAAPGGMWFDGLASYTNDTDYYVLGYHIE